MPLFCKSRLGYVSDEVLNKYENDIHYEVYPESGGVKYTTQWSITRSYRVGRNYIKFELFKFYEGTPLEVIDYWNKFAVHPDQIDKDGVNIAIMAKKLVYSFLGFGEALALSFGGKIQNFKISSTELVRLDRDVLQHNGWYTSKNILPITHHLDHVLSEKAFLLRQKYLDQFLVEGLNEKSLRKILLELGVDLDEFKSSEGDRFGSIKLLNILLNYLLISYESGLRLIEDSVEIVTRLRKEITELDLTKSLNALHSLRILDSHRSDVSYDNKLSKALKVFNINKLGITNNYLDACEIIYNKLSRNFEEASKWISSV